ncbi:VOC family protein [Hymenobacter sp. GOD-10R]|uniref:VOC family protein n=1 Tax=Hymenobacter sp. GOD-10R TaxID=3093922 RepID=UPI002D795F7A|nr:VOC family protein [Hymenobacter sp. GOD-10R]WRQ28352.1 VOC family protein [Hymenobacter sp. GOD-10R]
MTTPVLRVARPTNSIEALLPFYRDGLGLEVLYQFEDHNGFDGIMLGRRGCPYHFEFTHHRGHTVAGAPSQDNLLVFYLPDSGEWQKAVSRMQQQGFAPVPSYNFYWDAHGITFEDVDGYRVVLQHAAWE